MKYVRNLQEYSCKFPFLNYFLSGYENKGGSLIILLIMYMIGMLLYLFIPVIPITLSNWHSVLSTKPFLSLFFLIFGVLFSISLSIGLSKLLTRIADKCCSIKEYFKEIEITEDGIYLTDSRYDDSVFIPKDDIIHIVFNGDNYYNNQCDCYHLITNVKSNLSFEIDCYNFGGNTLKSLFIPNKFFRYAYDIPQYSNDGVDISLEIQKQLGIKIENIEMDMCF